MAADPDRCTRARLPERIYENPVVQAGVSSVAAGLSTINPVVGIIAASLPSLFSSAASERAQERIQHHLAAIESDLASMKQALDDMGDDQYKLVTELVSESLSTIDREKLRLLRIAVRQTVKLPAVVDGAGSLLSRVIRGLSYAEARFLLDNFGWTRIVVGADDFDVSPSDQHYGRILRVHPNSSDASALYGLISLGLIVSPASEVVSDLGRFRFSELAPKVIALLQD